MDFGKVYLIVTNLLAVAGRLIVSTWGTYKLHLHTQLHATSLQLLSTTHLTSDIASYYCLFTCQLTAGCFAVNFRDPHQCYLVKSPSWTEMTGPHWMAFILDIKTRKTLVTEDDADGCPKGFRFKFEEPGSSGAPGHRAHCYKLVSKEMNWNESLAACKSLGANLVSIESEEENDHVKAIIGNRIEGMWTSGTKIRGRWTWAATRLPFSFKSFHDFQPDHMPWERPCVRMWLWLNKYDWDDTDCSRRFEALCEMVELK